MAVGTGQNEAERRATRVGDKVALGLRLAPVRRVRAGGRPPFFAGTLALSTLARLQSISPPPVGARAGPDAGAATRRPLASRAAGANSSCRSRISSRPAASPRECRAQHEQNAVRAARSSSRGARPSGERVGRQKRGDRSPEIVREKRASHTTPTPNRPNRAVLLGALSSTYGYGLLQPWITSTLQASACGWPSGAVGFRFSQAREPASRGANLGDGMAHLYNLKYRLYDVSAAANYILDEKNSTHLRAVRLYEMQIAVMFGKKLNENQKAKREFPDRYLSVGSDMLASAYTCSAIKLLWRLNELNKSQENPASNFLDEIDARDIIKNILATPDSIRKVATAHRPRELDLRLQTRRRHQRWYAGLYDFSLRYDTEDSKRTGGPNTALSLLDQKQAVPPMLLSENITQT